MILQEDLRTSVYILRACDIKLRFSLDKFADSRHYHKGSNHRLGKSVINY